MAFDRPTLSALVARAETDLAAYMPEADALLRQGVLPALLRTQAGAASGLYAYLDWMALQLLPDTATGEELARHASLWGIARKAAVAATGTATIAGTDGAAVPAATQLLRSDGASYRTLALATVAGGTATLSLAADLAGIGANAATATKLRFVSPIAGVSGEAIVAAPGLAGGVAVESDDALRARILARIQAPPNGGNAADYVQWALAQPGVTRAWVSPHELGIGTVTLRFMCDAAASPVPDAGKVASVQAALDILRPVTAQLAVVAPVANPIAFQIAIVPASAAVQTAVEAELRDLIARDAVPGGTLLLSRMREAVSIASGETDNQIVAPAANVVSATGQIATFGSIAWVP